MTTIKIVPTSNPTIVKFEFPDFITRNNYEFQNIDQAKPSPLAQKLFYLPFVKTVYITSNFIAIERYNIVEWDDVQEEVATQIKDFLDNGGAIFNENADDNTKKNPTSIYAESTPNPGVMKFVANRMIVPSTFEFKNIEEAKHSKLAQALFGFPFVKEVFFDENYISITKYNVVEWNDVVQEMRNFIREFLEKETNLVDVEHYNQEQPQLQLSDEKRRELDPTSLEIIDILEQYVKPAVQSDGGNIMFDSYDTEQKRVKVILQGACSGCPSSTFTLKNGIEHILKDMLNDNEITVEAINM
ncbi:MAG: NifU family protein [Bacteroidota bacterium]|nr:NifU family protein [Bacteroidota bacterium]